VSVLVVVAGSGENVAVTPFGRPEADSVTALLNPPVGFTEIVLVVLALCFRDIVDGAAIRVKPSWFTTSDTEAPAVV
jgi:hypothetical protein